MKIKIQKDIPKARSILRVVENRKKFVKNFNKIDFSTIIGENYYEIIKELATALFFVKGIKFIGEYAHKELIEELVKELKLDGGFSYLLDDLRIRRNGSLYYGEAFEENYIKNNKSKIEEIIKLIENKIKKELK